MAYTLRRFATVGPRRFAAVGPRRQGQVRRLGGQAGPRRHYSANSGAGGIKGWMGRISGAEARLVELREENAKAIAALEAEHASSLSKVAEMSAAITSKDSIIAQKSEEIEALSEKLGNSEAAINSLNTNAEEASSEIEKMKAGIAVLEGQLEEKQKEHGILADEYQNFQNETNIQLGSLNAKIEGLQRDLEQATSNKGEVSEKLKATEAQIDDLKAQLAEQELELAKCKAEFEVEKDRLATEMASISTRLSTAQGLVTDVAAERDQLRSVITGLEEQLNQANEEFAGKENVLGDEIERLKVTLQEKEVQLAGFQEENEKAITAMQTENASSLSKVNELMANLSSRDDILAQKSEEIKMLNEKLSDSEAAIIKLDNSLEEAHLKMKAGIKDLEGRIEEKMKAQEEMNNQLSSQNAIIGNLQRDLELASNSKGEMSEKLKETETQVDDLKAQLAAKAQVYKLEEKLLTQVHQVEEQLLTAGDFEMEKSKDNPQSQDKLLERQAN